MESKDFKRDWGTGSITVHGKKDLYALDYAVSGAIDAYEALVKDTTIRDAFISFKPITDTTFRVEISVQVDPNDEELEKCYEITF